MKRLSRAPPSSWPSTGWLPCALMPSIGHVAQLAADLLGHTLRMARRGYLAHDDLLPFAGRDSCGPQAGIVASMEGEFVCGLNLGRNTRARTNFSFARGDAAVLSLPSSKIVLVLQRAPVASVREAHVMAHS